MKDPYQPLIWHFVGNMTEKEAFGQGLSISGKIKGKNLYHAYRMEKAKP